MALIRTMCTTCEHPVAISQYHSEIIIDPDGAHPM